MQQHPVPQQISSYQFRLVGEMTLKQFFQVAGGAIISLLIYASGLHPFLKWPLILISFSLGAAFAFLPFQDRPLSIWIFSFFRSIYSPTVFIWKRHDQKDVYFKQEGAAPQITGVATPHGKKALEGYLKVRPDQQFSFFTALESAEQGFLSKVTQLLNSAIPQTKEKETKFPSLDKQKTKFTVPQSKPVAVSAQSAGPVKIVVEEKPLKEAPQVKKKITSKVDPTLKEGKLEGYQAQFSPEAAPPLPPTLPNTIVGQVMDKNGKIIEGAILEIKDIAGRPVRALRTNKAGHFMIVTSLQDGTYNIEIEKGDYQFDPVTFKAQGKIIPPIAIRAGDGEKSDLLKSKSPKIGVHEISNAIN